MYKKSNYNYIYHLCGSDNYLITNFISDKTVKINGLQKIYYDSVDRYDIGDDIVKTFVDNGILIDEDIDELSYIKKKVKENVYDNSEVYFIICTTMRCNLSCVYCFEGKDKENVDMNIYTQDKTIEYIEKTIKESKTKRLRIWWYGGEPLLCPDIIDNMSKKILDMVDKYNIEYIARIVTNGTMLNQNNCDMLEKCKVSEAQITLDGATSEVHDKTRSYISGKGSFDDIVNNLYNIKTNICLHIVFIINKNNIKEYDKLKILIDDIKSKTKNKIDIRTSKIDINEKNESDTKELLVDEEYNIEDEKGKSGRKRFDVCSAQRYYQYVIDAKGDIFKCPNCMRNKNYIIGNVGDSDINEKLDTKNASLEFIDNKWLHPDDECVKCIYFPLCVGSCILPYRKKMCRDDYKRYLDNKLADMI